MIKTQPIQVYRMYLGVKLHFSDKKFNYVKAKGGVKVSPEALTKRKDRYYFEKLSESYSPDQLLGYFVSNFVYGQQDGAVINQEEGFSVYSNWKAKLERLSYHVVNEVQGLVDSDNSFNSFFVVEDGKHPILLKNHLKGDFSLETMLILDRLTNYLEDWRNFIKDEYVWPEIYNLLIRYSHFIDFGNIKQYKEKILEILR
jgi:hypothetical protein